VFAAYDPLLDRKVALKLLRSTESGVRLVREAQALARVTSPYVVAVYDAGVMEDEVYIAMELVEGGTLRAWLRELRPWREVAGVFEQAGRGLAAAHACGIVHRDFKPENVLFDRQRARVADFGLAIATPAAAAGDDAPIEHHVTLGAAAGTPAYMAPEQLAGETADARSDQFSYCVAFYEALYGERPFAGATVRELAAAIRAGAIRPATRRVPAWLRAVVTRGLASDPAERFASLDALLDQLARRRVKIRRTLFASAALAIAATSGGLALVVTRGDGPTCAAEPPEYDAAAVQAGLGAEGGLAVARLDVWRARVVELREQACRASKIEHTESEELFDLRMACLARSVERVQALAAELAKPSRKLADTAFAVITGAVDLEECTAPRPLLDHTRAPADPMLRAGWERARRRLADGHAADAAGRYAEAAKIGAEIARTAPTRALVAEGHHLHGRALENDRDHDAARAVFEQALIAAEASGHEVLQVQLYLLLAVAENRHDRRGDAARWIAQARALVERTGLASHLPYVLAAEGMLEIWRDQAAKAIAPLEEAIAGQDKLERR
jgi:tetratricopeptide (TPR) repeat protein